MNLQNKVSDFCAPYFADKNAIFTAESLTTAFIDKQLASEWPACPDDMKQALYIGIQQVVRPLCRHNAQDDIDEQKLLDLPEESLLQDRYSVPVKNGEQIYKYVPRHLLTEEDVVLICARDRKLSERYARRADALESWFYRFKESAG